MATKIKGPRLFDAVRDAVASRLRAGTTPTATLHPKQDGLVRAVGIRFLHDQYHGFDPKTILGNLVVRDVTKDWNRFSGLGPAGKVGTHGGLYTAMHTAPMINEVWHYASGKTTNVA